MAKGDNQKSNRETKKPKADKKLAPPAGGTTKPQDIVKPAGKGSGK